MHQGHLVKAAVELAKDCVPTACYASSKRCWPSPDETASLIITGNGDVIQPENDLIAIGSGGPYAPGCGTRTVRKYRTGRPRNC
ncbi:ATP-dependent protease peptidase subunit [Citrobacter koseri]|uniref:ATP-dependent protease peptidase subunit n=1 Tax=Citrobacter koseri TaxID=545 RepID=A0A2X2WQA5_CITKO|nr:ATP-dependent protease peptidase subunit [Citrobacter koseri]